MNFKKLIMPALVAAAPFFYGCEEKTDVVESGTYQGVVHEVEAEKTEIYVKTDDGKLLELYFTDNTTLTHQGETAPFEHLKEGGRVEVQIEKVGNRLDPIAVKILD
jgi:Cu/Ag efflux protein CusF